MDERITNLEMLVMHLQKTVQELDEVIQSQGTRINNLERDLKRLNLELGLLREAAIEERSPEEEKPPHY
jgi:SlyX protein